MWVTALARIQPSVSSYSDCDVTHRNIGHARSVQWESSFTTLCRGVASSGSRHTTPVAIRPAPKNRLKLGADGRPIRSPDGGYVAERVPPAPEGAGPMGYVYFAVAEGLDMVKIGWAKSSPQERVAALQIGCPVRLDLALFRDGTRSDERAWHATFRRYWSHGEWFRNARLILAAMETDHAAR